MHQIGKWLLAVLKNCIVNIHELICYVFVEKQAGAAHVKRLDFSDHSSFKPKVHFKFGHELLL
jgi:hypothetical protein